MRRRNSELRADEARAAWDAAQPSAPATVVRATCTLVTPMYGGGVAPGEVDRAMPIRATAIRGQLRFWWRLLNGAGRSSKDLFAAESHLWGGIAGTGPRASRVALHVDAEPAGSERMIEWGSAGLDAPRYSLILDPKHKPSLLNIGYEFTLTLRFANGAPDNEREQIIEALRWWASFGGVGARTRRGLGAVKVNSDGVPLRPVSRQEVESRGGRMVLRRASRNPVEAWREAVTALSDFRQAPNVGRNPGRGSRPGRSRWPEPDAIRRHRHRNAPRHQPQHPVDGQYYPRAAFGLPIVFHFKDRRDPPDAVLQPCEGERMASSLILRAYFDGTQYRPLAVLLPGWAKCVSVPVSFGSERLGPAWPDDSGKRTELAERVLPMQGRSADALTAFLHYFEHHARERHGRSGRGRGGR